MELVLLSDSLVKLHNFNSTKVQFGVCPDIEAVRTPHISIPLRYNLECRDRDRSTDVLRISIPLRYNLEWFTINERDAGFAISIPLRYNLEARASIYLICA